MSTERTTIFALATPMRTSRPRPLLSRQSWRSAALTASTSTTSPSRTTPGCEVGGRRRARAANGAVERDLGGDDAAGLDVEPDDVRLRDVGAQERAIGSRRYRPGVTDALQGFSSLPAIRLEHRSTFGRSRAEARAPPAAPRALRTCRGTRRRSPRRRTAPTTPPSARNGPNGTAVLRPSATPLRRHDRDADERRPRRAR